MTVLSKAMALLAISVVFAASGNQVLAKPSGSPGQVHPSGNSSGPSGGGSSAGGDLSKRRGGCDSRHCDPNIHQGPGATQQPCRGGHRGPNGVMIQCQ
jgi:hypothetical protein